MDFDALVIGGGFAGLSCASALAEQGLRVAVAEKKPHLGGRAFSFRDPETGSIVDNGQHLFMGCYRQTRAFLRRIGTEGCLQLLPRIRVDYADAHGRRDVLRCPQALGSPLHLAAGVLGLRGLSLRDKAGLWRFDRAMRALDGGSLDAIDGLTVREWLTGLGQSPRVQERLFDPLALGILNERPELASATGLVQALREVFYRDVESTRLALSRVGLSDLYTDGSRRYIEARGGAVLLSRKVSALLEEDGGVAGACFEGGESLRAPVTVSTLPPWDLAKLPLPQPLLGSWRRLAAAPIVGVNLWLDRPVLDVPLVGLLGTETHWAFDKSKILGEAGGGQYLSLVVSGARKLLAWEPKALLELAKRDLARCLPAFQKATIQRWKVVKEPFATLSPVPGAEALRPRAASAGMKGFVWSGDWTRTGLPATIESAVVSGHAAAEAVRRLWRRGAADVEA